MDEQLNFEEMLTDLVDQYFPKNDTAAQGGDASPGRGEAMVIVAWAITHHQALLATEYDRGKVEVLEIVYGWRTNGTVNSVPYSRSVIRADAVADLIVELKSKGEK